jgi:hypothetical protein
MKTYVLIVAGLLSCLAPAVWCEPAAQIALDARAPAEGTLTTTVKDPAHPDEPWVVTSFIRLDESFQAFALRHREMVEAVRAALR